MDGFTLVELLIVVVILGILIGISVPSYQNYLEKFQIKQAIAACQQLAAAENAYHLETGNWELFVYNAALATKQACFQNLSLDFAQFDNADWQYGFQDPGALGGPVAYAVRRRGVHRTKYVYIDPSQVGAGGDHPLL